MAQRTRLHAQSDDLEYSEGLPPPTRKKREKKLISPKPNTIEITAEIHQIEGDETGDEEQKLDFAGSIEKKSKQACKHYKPKSLSHKTFSRIIYTPPEEKEGTYGSDYDSCTEESNKDILGEEDSDWLTSGKALDQSLSTPSTEYQHRSCGSLEKSFDETLHNISQVNSLVQDSRDVLEKLGNIGKTESDTKLHLRVGNSEIDLSQRTHPICISLKNTLDNKKKLDTSSDISDISPLHDNMSDPDREEIERKERERLAREAREKERKEKEKSDRIKAQRTGRMAHQGDEEQEIQEVDERGVNRFLDDFKRQQKEIEAQEKINKYMQHMPKFSGTKGENPEYHVDEWQKWWNIILAKPTSFRHYTPNEWEGNELWNDNNCFTTFSFSLTGRAHIWYEEKIAPRVKRGDIQIDEVIDLFLKRFCVHGESFLEQNSKWENYRWSPTQKSITEMISELKKLGKILNKGKEEIAYKIKAQLPVSQQQSLMGVLDLDDLECKLKELTLILMGNTQMPAMPNISTAPNVPSGLASMNLPYMMPMSGKPKKEVTFQDEERQMTKKLDDVLDQLKRIPDHLADSINTFTNQKRPSNREAYSPGPERRSRNNDRYDRRGYRRNDSRSPSYERKQTFRGRSGSIDREPTCDCCKQPGHFFRDCIRYQQLKKRDDETKRMQQSNQTSRTDQSNVEQDISSDDLIKMMKKAFEWSN